MKHGTIVDNLLVRYLPNHINNVHTESTNPFINPEIHHLIDFMTELFVFPVKVWLFLTEKVQVILTSLFVILPGRTTEN